MKGKEEFINVFLNNCDETVKLSKPIKLETDSRVGLVQCINLASVSQILKKDFVKVLCRRQIVGRKHILLHPKLDFVVSQIQRQFKNTKTGAEIKIEKRKIHINVPLNIVIFATKKLATFLGVATAWRNSVTGKPSLSNPYIQSQYLYFYDESKPFINTIKIPKQNFLSSDSLKKTINEKIKDLIGSNVEQNRKIIKLIYSSNLTERMKNTSPIQSIGILLNILENEISSNTPLLRNLRLNKKSHLYKNIEYKKPNTIGTFDHLHFSILGDQVNQNVSVTGRLILTIHINHV